MARPQEYDDRITTSLRLAPTLMKELRRIADEREVSVNHLIVRAIEEFIPRLAPLESVLRTTEQLDRIQGGEK